MAGIPLMFAVLFGIGVAESIKKGQLGAALGYATVMLVLLNAVFLTILL